MNARQCEIAGEAYAASLLARAGFDVLVQYGANQPDYDLIAVKGRARVPISVKGSQTGAWALAQKYYKKGGTYHGAIDSWLAAQPEDLVFVLVQFSRTTLADAPRAYIAKPDEIANELRQHREGAGGCVLQEDIRQHRGRTRYVDAVPERWAFTQVRVDEILSGDTSLG